jgi:peptidoglycan/LPS O-acetylase OafA/YrhL
MEKRYDAIDGLRTLACMGIVSMHMLASGSYNVSGFLFDKFIPSLANLVFLFMTISAFGMCCGYYNKVLNHQLDVVDFYKKRYKKILPFFSFLCVIDLISSPSKESFYEAYANITLCFGLIPNADIKVIGVGWFLGIIFVFYMIFPFFCFLLADKRMAWFVFAASAVMNVLSTIYFNVDRKYMPYSFMFFIAGGLVYLYKAQLNNRAAKLIAIIGFLISGYIL